MEISQARQVSMYLCREIMGVSLSNIGIHFGGRDHTTVMHAVKSIKEKTTNDEKTKIMIGAIKQDLGYTFS